MRVTLLGTGTSTGVPVIGCRCAVCTSDSPYNKRTRTSLALNVNDKNIIFDTSPEFRLQVLRADIRTLRAVIYTHIHADHCHGFDDLRAFYFQGKEAVPCYLGREHEKEFKSRFSYAFEDTGYLGAKPQIDLRMIPQRSPFHIDELEIDFLRLPHGNVVSYAYRVGRFAYATDFKKFAPEQIAQWQGKIDTMVASGIHFGEHATHSTIPETIELFQKLKVREGIITHIAHDVDHVRDEARLPPGIRFGYDGMNFTVNNPS